MPIVVTLGTARTLGQLKARVADELARADLASQITLAIEDAISEAATNRFWFNEVSDLEIPILAGLSAYGSDELAAMVEIDDVWLQVNGQRRNLRVANDRDVDRLHDGNGSAGEPYLYSIYGDRLRLYPTPTQDYSLFVDGSSRLLPLTDDGQTNGWTDQAKGERYVRALTKRNVLAEVVYDLERADIQGKLAEKYKSDMLAQTYDRVATGEMACYG